ncbi:MAG: hypothetical protein Q8R37_01090 [Nanoarchaeota archaeon]|nr:hypothetical protein [Nanoarchaeota archaeon]
MSLDYITQEQCKLYKTVRDKEMELKSVAGRDTNDGVFGLFIGIPFAVAHGYGLAVLDDFSASKVIFLGSLTVGGIYAIGYGVRGLVKGHRAKKNLTAEIQELKASADYQAVEKMLE